MAKLMGRTAEQVERDLDRDNHLSPAEALSLELADVIGYPPSLISDQPE